MKRLILLLVSVALIATVLVSCGGHTHSFSSDWSKNATHHWHDCTDPNCTERVDNAMHSHSSPVPVSDGEHKMSCECGDEIIEAHTFGEGELTTAPTPDADGVMTYTCSGCGKEKTEPVEYLPPAPTDYVLDPYASVDWDDALQIKSMSHMHVTTQDRFNSALLDGYKHFAISHYAPSVPFYPLENFFTGIPDDVIGSPNTEKAFNTNGAVHFCSLGSFAIGHGNVTGAIAPWQTAFDEVFDQLQFPDAGGITINHPDYPETVTYEEYVERLDYDDRVLGIEIFNYGTGTIYTEMWDSILSTGRRCWGFSVVDWQKEGSYGSNILLVPALTEYDCLKAYRDGNFYSQLKDTGLRFTELRLEGGRVYVSTNRECEIKFFTANGNEKTVNGEDATFDVTADDVFVRVEAKDFDDDESRIFSNPFMFADYEVENRHTHTVSEEWTSDGTHHWHALTCNAHVGCAYTKLSKGEHTDENDDNYCDVCEISLICNVTVSESSDKIELTDSSALVAPIGSDVTFTVAVDGDYSLVVVSGAKIVGRPRIETGRKLYTVKVSKIAQDTEVVLDVKQENLYDYSSLGTGESGTATSTLYYDPATNTYFAESTGAAGEITYTITYKNGATTSWDAVNNTYTIDKSATITALVASDGSAAITFNGVSYGVGDKIPSRTFFYSTNTGTKPRLFASGAELTFVGPVTKSLSGDILYEFSSDFIIDEINGAGNRFFISLVGGNTTHAITAVYFSSGTADAVFGPSSNGMFSSNNGAWAELADAKFNLRVTVSKSDEDNVDVQVYLNGRQAGATLTVPKFALESVKLTLQDDGSDRNTAVTMSNTYFIKYEFDYKSLEPTTSHLATENKTSETATKTVYEKDGVFSTESSVGAKEYIITYKTSLDVTVNPDGSVTYSKLATIVSIVSEMRETTISYLGVTYGSAANGVVNVIPSRDWLGISRGFAAGGSVFDGSYGRTTPTQYNVTSPLVDKNILSVVEFDITVTSTGSENLQDNFIASLTFTGAGGNAVTTAALARVGSDVLIKRFDVGGHERNGVKVAELGETFTLRFEYRQNSDGVRYDYMIFVNGTHIFTKTLDTPNRHEFSIGFRDDAPERNNVLVLENFKYLKYVFPN